jgi:hypothetical protein
MPTEKDLCIQFLSILDSGAEEAPLQTFLENHTEVLVRAFSQGAQYPVVIPKFRLAGSFIPDFVMIGHRSSYSWDVDLIEIEPAILERPLFNQERQSTGRLRGAESQITDWQNWMRANGELFTRSVLQELKSRQAWDARPQFYNLSNGTSQDMVVWYRIIIGRRSDFEGWGNQYRTNTWDRSNHREEIVTWDRLLDKV